MAAAPIEIDLDVPPVSNPDLKFCVWPKAYDRSVQTIVDAVFEVGTLIQLYESSSEFVNVLVTNVVKPKFQIEINPGKLTWRLDNARFIIRADEMALRTVKTFVKVVSGSFTVDILVTPTAVLKEPSFNVRINLSCASSPGFNLTDIDSTPAPLSSDADEGRKGDEYVGGDADFKHTSAEMNFRLDATTAAAGDSSDQTIGGKRSCSDGEPGAKRQRRPPDDDQVESTDRLINEEICNCLLQAFADLVMERLNGGLPVSSSLHGDDDSSCCGGGWMCDFSETAMPEFQTGFLVSNHLSAIRYAEETIRGPAPVFPFPEPQNSGRMLTVFISNCVFNAVGCYFHQHNILNYTLTQAEFAAAVSQGNSTTNASGKTRCLSDCFPQFSVKYPGASMEVSMASAEAPTTTFSGRNLKVKLNGSATFRAHLPDTSLVDILATKVTVEAVVPVTLEVGMLVGQVARMWPTTWTYVENDANSVDCSVLKEVLNQIAAQFLREKFNAIAQRGIPLPRPLIPGAVQFQNTEMRTEENYLRVDTDLEFRG